jgi:hypothetical protein
MAYGLHIYHIQLSKTFTSGYMKEKCITIIHAYK